MKECLDIKEGTEIEKAEQTERLLYFPPVHHLLENSSELLANFRVHLVISNNMHSCAKH